MITPDLVTRSNRRTLSLAVLKDGQIVVKAPLKMSMQSIERFVYEKQDWIKQKLALIENNRQKFDDVISYNKFLLFGNRYDLKLASVKNIQTSNSELCIYMPKNIAQEKIMSKIKNWYKKMAKSTLEERINYISGLIKIYPKSMKITDSKGRWGACNSKGNISFNFRVIMLEPAVIDYVIVHELCHLIEMNHSKKFWNIVNSFLPNAPELKEKIKEYSFLLTLFHNKV